MNMDSRRKVSRSDVRVLAYGIGREDYFVSQRQADIMVARGQARPLDNGTRAIKETRVSVRGEQRSWRKVTNRTVNGAALYSSMQLVPGVSQGRNTGARHRGNR
jgi:hypothetical protein